MCKSSNSPELTNVVSLFSSSFFSSLSAGVWTFLVRNGNYSSGIKGKIILTFEKVDVLSRLVQQIAFLFASQYHICIFQKFAMKHCT